MISEETFKQALKLIEKSKNILLLPSSPPDGDSIGSSLALYEVFKKIGKNATVVCADPIPELYQFLPTTDTVKHELTGSKDLVISVDTEERDVDHIQYEVEENKVNIIITPKKGTLSQHDVSFKKGLSNYDLIITVDTADVQQLGFIYEQNVDMFFDTPVINIDHHASNDEFGHINMVDITASATTEIIYRLFQDLQQQHEEMLVTEDIATLLLAGIITDTGSFQHSNTTPRAFTVAAELLDLGARQQEIIKHVYKTKDLSTLKLWGIVLSKIQYVEEYRIIYSSVRQEDLEEAGADMEDAGAIIDDLISHAPGAEVALLIKEKGPDFVSGSVRTPNKGANANDIARIWGGGGHPKAAGFRIKGKPYEEAVEEILEKIKEYQAGHLDIPAKKAKKVETGSEDKLLEKFREGKLLKTKKKSTKKVKKKLPSKDIEGLTVADVLEDTDDDV